MREGNPIDRETAIRKLMQHGLSEKEASKLVPSTIAETTRDSLTETEYDLFVRKAKSIEDDQVKAILLLLPVTGMRVSEAVGLRSSDVIIYTPGQIYIVFFGKGGKERALVLGREGRRIITTYADLEGEFCWPNRIGTGPIAASRIQEACREIAQSNPYLARLTPHVLRHTYASRIFAVSSDVKQLQAELGHTSRKMTFGYIHEV